jgi:hypothetical protein
MIVADLCLRSVVVRAAANIAFAQSPPGIGRKRPSLPGQLPGDRASAVPLQLPQMRPVRGEIQEEEDVLCTGCGPRYSRSLQLSYAAYRN